jgi:Leucine-rich repeat (LRR) protein
MINFIREIQINSFVNLHNLSELKLDNNLIENVSNNAFSNLRNLKLLDISFNRMTSFEWLSSSGLTHLKRLDNLNLSNNQIEIIKDETFRYHSLSYLDLSCNRIRNLSEKMFNGLSSIFTAQFEQQ